ncbi:MAG: hypothetical protein ABFR95_09790 [Actinomycetota bacterium]
MPQPQLADAYAALSHCEETLLRLEKLCCEPGRSPRMAALAETLTAARASLDLVDDGSGAIAEIFAELEDAGAQLGSLQIGCCAPARLPLYADMLKDLTEVQLTVSQSAGVGH